MLRVVGGCAFQLLLYGIAQTPGMLLSTPGRLTGTSLWGPPEQFKHTPCIYLKLRGPELCLSAFDYPISGQSLGALTQAHRDTLERKGLLADPVTGLCPLVERSWELRLLRNITKAAFKSGRGNKTPSPHGGTPRCVPDRYAPHPPSPSRAPRIFDPTYRASPRSCGMPHARHTRTP